MEGNPGNFCLWINESWALEFRIQLKESGYQVLLTKIPDSSYCVWYPESKTVLEFPFTGRKRQSTCKKKIVYPGGLWKLVLALLVSGI